MITGSTCCPAPRYQGLVRTEFDRRAEDFQSSDMVLEIGTHVHETTPNDVVTRLRTCELCHWVTLCVRQFRHI